MTLFGQNTPAVLGLAILSMILGGQSDQPVRINPEEAAEHLVKQVEPALPRMAKIARIGGIVALQATISPEGKVKSVQAISGHPVLIQAVLDAVQQWEYRPFMRAGQAMTVVTRVEWNVPSAAQTPAQEAAMRDYDPAFRDCYSLVRSQAYVDAEKRCAEAVKLADQLPPQRVLERSSSRTFFAHSLLEQGKVEASIPVYRKALELRSTTEGADHDADFAWNNANLARAYFRANQLDNADPLYARAITIFEAALTALPEMKDRYTEGLKNTLLEYAKLKDTRGEHDRARDLALKADTLESK
jgi:TonB family protein